jgi:hypothetical protein
LARRLVAGRRPFADRALADGDDPPFEERELEIAAGIEEKHSAVSDVAA